VKSTNQMQSNSLTAKQAMAAVQFLQRADLKGAEVPAFVEVMQALSALAQPQAKASPQAGPSPQASAKPSAKPSAEGGAQ